MGKLDDEIL